MVLSPLSSFCVNARLVSVLEAMTSYILMTDTIFQLLLFLSLSLFSFLFLGKNGNAYFIKIS